MSSRNGRANAGPRKLNSNSAASIEPKPLTPRELEVVTWIAAGKRNGEIAKILGCRMRTVKKHVQNILEKLDVETRTGACTWWHEHGKNLVSSGNGKPN